MPNQRRHSNAAFNIFAFINEICSDSTFKADSYLSARVQQTFQGRLINIYRFDVIKFFRRHQYDSRVFMTSASFHQNYHDEFIKLFMQQKFSFAVFTLPNLKISVEYSHYKC